VYSNEEKAVVTGVKAKRETAVICAMAVFGMLLIIFLSALVCKTLKKEHKPVYAYKSRPGNAALSIIAHRNGYFAEEGFVVRVFPSGPVCVEALLYGDADFAEMGDAAFLSLASRYPYVWVCAHAGGASRDRIIARNDAGIESVEDLKGKKIGIQFGTSCMAGMLKLTKARGLSLRRNKELINIKPADMVMTLKSGEIQVLCCSEPVPSKALAMTACHEVSTLEGYGSNFPMGIAVKDEYARKNPEIVKSMLRALIRAETFISNHLEQAISIQSSATGEDPDIIRSAMTYHFYHVGLAEESCQSLAVVGQFLEDEGTIDTAPAVEDIVDDRYLKELGRGMCGSIEAKQP
jgi:ABC-type nitrate/sulfonate/bicarbonate transport system substrate-binding protein